MVASAPIVARLIVIGGGAAVGVQSSTACSRRHELDAQTYHLRPAAWIRARLRVDGRRGRLALLLVVSVLWRPGVGLVAPDDARRRRGRADPRGDVADGGARVLRLRAWIDVPHARATAAAAALAFTPAALVFSGTPRTISASPYKSRPASFSHARLRHRDAADAASRPPRSPCWRA